MGPVGLYLCVVCPVQHYGLCMCQYTHHKVLAIGHEEKYRLQFSFAFLRDVMGQRVLCQRHLKDSNAKLGTYSFFRCPVPQPSLSRHSSYLELCRRSNRPPSLKQAPSMICAGKPVNG
eukprot:scaffold46325_cov19-Prasinocladus_malaysianus.AAC.1